MGANINKQITGFHLDEENHWVADLECGHAQHVRHDPPWFTREWVTTEVGRKAKVGSELNCVRCDELVALAATIAIDECRRSLLAAYESAGISGLCGEGRWEAATGSLQSIDLKNIIELVAQSQVSKTP